MQGKTAVTWGGIALGMTLVMTLGMTLGLDRDQRLREALVLGLFRVVYVLCSTCVR